MRCSRSRWPLSTSSRTSTRAVRCLWPTRASPTPTWPRRCHPRNTWISAERVSVEDRAISSETHDRRAGSDEVPPFILRFARDLGASARCRARRIPWLPGQRYGGKDDHHRHPDEGNERGGSELRIVRALCDEYRARARGDDRRIDEVAVSKRDEAARRHGDRKKRRCHVILHHSGPDEEFAGMDALHHCDQQRDGHGAEMEAERDAQPTGMLPR